MYHLLKQKVLLACCMLVWAGLAQAEQPVPAQLAPCLLPSRLPMDNLWQQPLPGPRKQVEVPWVLQAAGALVLYSAEYRTREQYDSGRPPLPTQDHPTFFYPTPRTAVSGAAE